MGTQILAIALLVAAPTSDEGDHDLADLMAAIGTITNERWELTFDADTNTISFYSRQKIAATARSGGYPPFEQMYRIQYRFRVVPGVDESKLRSHDEQVKRDLARFRDLARTIPQKEGKGYITYSPQTAAQWQVVLQVKRAELRVQEIPQYAFKGIYLVESYGMLFTPRTGDRLGEATGRDINRVFAILRPLAPGPAPYSPKSE